MDEKDYFSLDDKKPYSGQRCKILVQSEIEAMYDPILSSTGWVILPGHSAKCELIGWRPKEVSQEWKSFNRFRKFSNFEKNKYFDTIKKIYDENVFKDHKDSQIFYYFPEEK